MNWQVEAWAEAKSARVSFQIKGREACWMRKVLVEFRIEDWKREDDV